MKFVGLISGGKDSIYTIQECILQQKHELICTAYIIPPENSPHGESNSYMFQSAAHNVVPILSRECLDVPCITRTCIGTSTSTSLNYSSDRNDEVEDLYELLKDVKNQFPEVAGVSVGAIFSTYQRLRVEHVCSRLNLTPLAYLWRVGPQKHLLSSMIQDGIHAILVKVAAPGLSPTKHLGKSLAQLCPKFESLYEKFQFQMCGEGGEYESLVLDCPIFFKTLVIDESEIVYIDEDQGYDADDPENYQAKPGVFIIKKFHTEEKQRDEELILRLQQQPALSIRLDEEQISQEFRYISEKSLPLTKPKVFILPHAKIQYSSGIAHLSAIQPSQSFKTPIAEFQEILQTIEIFFQKFSLSAQDVVMVHLYLSQISLFSQINQLYKDFFGTYLPPSRSCVAIGNCGKHNIMMDLLIQKNSGAMMRTQDSFNPRQVLHVQSMSHWAPICVGPYSQSNTLRNGLVFVAGQIGLNPPTMSLPNSWQKQLQYAWKNAASILDALQNDSIQDLLLGCLVYLHPSIQDWDVVHQICNEALKNNANIVPGQTDDVETFESSSLKEIPSMLLISIPEMPVGALVEIELVCITKKAKDSLDLQNIKDLPNVPPKQSYFENITVNWDCDALTNQIEFQHNHNDIFISLSGRFIPYCVAFLHTSINISSLKDQVMMSSLFSAFQKFMKTIQLNLTESTKLRLEHVLHFRCYYCQEDFVSIDQMKHAFYMALGMYFGSSDSSAVTFVPVLRLSKDVLFDCHILACDFTHFETELWVRSKR